MITGKGDFVNWNCLKITVIIVIICNSLKVI